MRTPPPPPPLHGLPICRQNEISRDIEDQLANLRASPRERQALEERVSHHRYKEFKHRARHSGANPSGDADMSLCSNDSVGSLSSDGDFSQGRKTGNVRRWRKGGRRRRLSASTRAAEASGRMLAQALHAQSVVRRKRYFFNARKRCIVLAR